MQVGAVARAALTVRTTGATALNTGSADVRDAGDRAAAVGARVARARGWGTAGAVITGLASGTTGRAGPTAAVIATRLARAVRRAARFVDTDLDPWTTNTGAAWWIAVYTLAGIAGISQAGRTTDVVCRAALAVRTEPRAAVAVAGAGSTACTANAGPAGTDPWATVGVASTTGVAVRDTAHALPGRTVAVVGAAVGVAGARARVCDTAGAAVAGLGGRTRRNTGAGAGLARQALLGITGSRQTGGAADVQRGAARLIVQAGLAGIAANAIAAIARATVSTRAAVVPGRNARTAHAVLTNLNRGGAAVCARVTGAIAAAPDAADLGRADGAGACVAKPFALRSITGALSCRRCIGTEHLCAPFGAVPIGLRSTKDGADPAEAKYPADRRDDDRLERVSPWSRTGQRLG